MAGISIGHLVHTDRPLTWRSQPSCPRCTLPFTSNTPDELVHRVAYLLDCQHLLCGQCVQENAQERCITCKICKHRTDIPEDCENATQALHPSLFVLGVMQQFGYEMANVEAYWQGDGEGSPDSDYPQRSASEKLSHSDVDKPKKLLSLLEKAYNTYEKSKKLLEKQSKIQQDNVGSVVEQINAHFIACHNALQIEENRVLQEARNAYIERHQNNKKDLRQLKMAKDRLQDYIKKAKLFPHEPEKQAESDSDASWKQFRREVKSFLEKEPMKLEGDGKKMLRAPIHYQPREAFLRDIQACHSLQIDALQDDASLVPITHTEAEKLHESANALKSSSKHKGERKSRERSKEKSSSLLKHKEERRARERSKESSSSVKHKEERRARERSKESSSSVKHKEERRGRDRSKEPSPSKRREERKTGDKPKEPSKSHRSTGTETKDHKRSHKPTGDSWSVGKSEPGTSESREGKPAQTAWQKALARMQARAKGRENAPELADRSDRDRASTTISDRLNSTQSSSRHEWESRDDGGKWRTVNVTHIVSPREFYVQDELFDDKGASSMSELCNTDAQAYEPVLITGSAPITITPGSIYLVRAEGFGELAWNNRWYRAEVQAVDYPNRGQYWVQYIDYGMYDTVEREQIRPLSEEVAAIAPKATRCALYRLQPAQGAQQWTDECHQVMKDFIGGRPMRMHEMSTFSDGTLLVDLFLPPVAVPGMARGRHDSGKQWEGRYAPMSLRAALIYLMVAEDANEIFQQDDLDDLNDILRKRARQQQRWLKNAAAWTLRHADIPHAPVLQEHDHFDCTITHAKSIELFHIMPNEWKTTMLEPLQRHLDAACQATSRVYCPYVGLVCAFATHDKDGRVGWLRGRVMRVLRARCLLLALDTGELLETPWTDMRLLAPDDPALYRHPLAVRCSLGHIRPRRANPGACWSKEAVTEFLQIACSRALRFTVSMGPLEPVPGNSYSVLLYLVNKSDRDTCVNGLLVRNGHAECIGLEENVQDRIRELAPGELAVKQEPSEPTPTTATDVAAVRVADPRMSVVMLRVVSPGEFYVLLCEQQCAFEQMHKLLQDHMDDRIDEEEEEEDEQEEEDEEDDTVEEETGEGAVKKKEGKRKTPGDVCVVFARVNEGDPCEWHRARIETVLDDGVHYEAFLIDRAVTTRVHRTNVARLTARMAQIQPVAFRCRLACLSPVGGSTVWHQSSLDAFRKLIASYAQHAISLDAKPKPNEPDQALPVVLWGVRVEDCEALAPSRTVYYNLNQALAKLGLAHRFGRFRTFATSGSEAAEEHQLLEDAIRGQLRAEMEQFFRTVAAVNGREQAGAEGGGAGAGGEGGEDGGGGAVRDGIKTAENVLNEQKNEWMDSQCRKALGQVGSAEGGKPVHAWLPAAPLEKTIFVGVPTYVGSDGTVFLHDVVHEPLLDRIRFVIQKHVASNPDVSGAPFAVGRACLARFHLDGQFYRASVKQKLDDDRFMVTFVDYGNVEECTGADLLPAAVCGAVPVQAVQVRLSGVTPKGEKEQEGNECKRKKEKKHQQQPHAGPRKWPEAALDACHALIVQKRCSIRVVPNNEGPSGNSYGIPPTPYCTLQLLEVMDGARVDVADALLELGLFERRRNRRVSVTSQSSLISPSMTEPQADVLRRELLGDLLHRPSVALPLPPTITPADRDLKQWIENIGTQFEAQHAANSTKHEDPNEWNSDDTPDPLNHAQLIDALEPIELADWHEPAAGTSGGSESGFRMVTLEIADMSPMPSPATLNSEEFETSSRLSEDGMSSPDAEDSGWLPEAEHLEEGRIASPLFRSFPVLPQPERLSRGFFAEFTNYACDQTLYVYPHLEGHTRRMITVAERVQRRAHSNNELHRWQASLAEPGAPCLAPYKEDGLYYRAIVESRDEQRREVSVLYVDYLNRETVPLAELRKCPIELQRATLRNLPVRLAGVRTNPRLREDDVVRRLSDLLEKPFFVKLVGQQDSPRRGDASVLPVELYTDADCRTLIYQQMIDEKYFVQLRASEER